MKKKRFIRTVSMALSILFIASCLAPTAFAEEAYEEIWTRADLEAIDDSAEALAKNYKLMADIDLSGAEWQPLGAFTGTLDGNGHVISGMHSGTAEAPSTILNWGLFGIPGSGIVVKNIIFKDVYFYGDVSGTTSIGAVVGYSKLAMTIENIAVVSGSMYAHSTQTRIGGIMGCWNSPSGGPYGYITNCFNAADVSASSSGAEDTHFSAAGGIIGGANGRRLSINSCVNVGRVSLTSKTSSKTASVASNIAGAARKGTATVGGFYSGTSVQNSYALADRLSVVDNYISDKDAAGTTVLSVDDIDDASNYSEEFLKTWSVRAGYFPMLSAFSDKAVSIYPPVDLEELDSLMDTVVGTKYLTEDDVRAVLDTKLIKYDLEFTRVSEATEDTEGLYSIKVVLPDLTEYTRDIVVPKMPRIDYAFGLTEAGMAQGTVIVNLFDDSLDKEYALYWGDGNGPLAGYTYLARRKDFVVVGSSLVYNVAERVMIPAEATHLWLVLDGVRVYSYEIPAERRVSVGELKYSFGVISDTHIFGDVNGETEFVKALRLFEKNGARFVIIAGDVTGAGRESYWKNLNAVVEQNGITMPVFVVPGNHDVLRRWCPYEPSQHIQYMVENMLTYGNEDFTEDANGNKYKITKGDTPVDYTVEFGEDLFVYLGIGMVDPGKGENSQTDQHLSPEQIEWLKKVFDKAEDYENVFLTFHYAAFESGFASYDSGDWSWKYDGYMTEGYSSAEELYNILKDHPNVIMFSGHTHRKFDNDKNLTVTKRVDFNYDDYTWTEGTDPLGFTAVHVPTSQYYEGYLVSAYDTGVVLSGYNTDTAEITSRAYFYLPKTLSAASSALTTELPREAATGDIIDLSVKGDVEVEWSVLEGGDICSIGEDGKLTVTGYGTIMLSAKGADGTTAVTVISVPYKEHLSGTDAGSAVAGGTTQHTNGNVTYYDYGNGVTGQSTTYTVFSNTDGEYYLGILYNIGSNTNRALRLTLNGESTDISFVRNSDVWGGTAGARWSYRMVRVTLKKGINTFKFAQYGSNKCPQVSDLRLFDTDEWLTAEDAPAADSAAKKDNAYGFDGTAYVGEVSWSVNVPVSGLYRISAVYSAAPSNIASPVNILVNGRSAADITPHATATSCGNAWDILEADMIYLEAGENTVTLRSGSGAYFGGISTEFVGNVVSTEGIQESDDAKSVRLVGEIYGIEYKAAGFEIKVDYTDKNGVATTTSEELKPMDVHYAYTSIIAGNNVVTPSSEGYYLIVMEINEIPDDAQELTISFRAYVEGDDGSAYGETYIYDYVDHEYVGM